MSPAITTGLLLLGLYKPPTGEALLQTLVLSVGVGIAILNQHPRWLLSYWILLGYIFYTLEPSYWPVYVLAPLVIFFFVKWFRVETKPKIFLVGTLLFFGLLAIPEQAVVRQKLATEPAAEGYFTDADLYLKTYYLFGQNHNYYKSLETAMVASSNQDRPQIVVWAWRLPIITWVWQLLTAGDAQNLYWWFLGSMMLFLSLIYQIMKQVTHKPQIALLAVYVVIPYLIMPLTSTGFLMTEWWVLVPLLLTFWGLVENKYLIAGLMGILSVSIREQTIYVWLVIGALAILLKKWRLAGVALAVGGFFVALVGWHTAQIKNQAQGSYPVVFHNRVHPLGMDLLAATLNYNKEGYLFSGWPLLEIILGLAVAQFLLMPTGKIIWPATIMVIPALILRIGQGVWNDYWGVMFMPFMFMLAARSVQVKFK